MADMAEELARLVAEDFAQIPENQVTASSQNERAMKLLSHMFLRLWTRIALETGQRLTLAPPQFALGTYEGKMNWILSENFDFKLLQQIGLSAKYSRRHALVGEVYTQKGEDRVRMFFALEEEEVKGKPVFVNYLIIDTPVTDFSVKSFLGALKPALGNWYETIATKTDGPLWDYCKDKLECVGV